MNMSLFAESDLIPYKINWREKMNRLANLWNRIFPIPKVKDEAAAQLAQAELDLLEAHANAEYYSSLVYMLRNRVQRLEEASK